MTAQQVFDGLKEILAVIRPSQDLSTVTMESQLVRDLGIDSLTMMLLSLAVEDKFKMQFPAGQAPFGTVGEVCEYVAGVA